MFGYLIYVLRYHVRNSNSSVSRLTNTKPKYILSNFATMTTKTRIVLNHSTHVDGLIVALTKNAALTASKGISTIVPGRISRTRGGNAQHLILTVSIKIPGGYKAIARRGSMIQEVFVTTTITDETELQDLLNTVAEIT